jgi:hypothetical protein
MNGVSLDCCNEPTEIHKIPFDDINLLGSSPIGK